MFKSTRLCDIFNEMKKTTLFTFRFWRSFPDKTKSIKNLHWGKKLEITYSSLTGTTTCDGDSPSSSLEDSTLSSASSSNNGLFLNQKKKNVKKFAKI